MHILHFVITAFLLFPSSTFASDMSSSTESEPYIAKMFSYAKSHNLEALENLRSEVDKSNRPLLTHAYSAALYMADHKNYEDEFVRKFPTDKDTIMKVLYPLGLMDPPGFLYSIGAIGEIATRGNEKAIEKAVHAVANSDGAATELLCQYVIALLDKHLESTLEALSHIDPLERKDSYACFIDSKPQFLSLKKKIKSQIKTKRPLFEKIEPVIQEIDEIENIEQYNP